MSKTMLKFSLMAMALAGILFACQHDFEEPDGDGQLSVAGARAWYEAHKPEYLILKSGQGNGKETLVKPNWENAKKEENSKVEVITVNLLTNRGFGFSTADSKKAFDETKEFGYMISLTQMVILKDKKTRNTIGFLMTHIGDKSCLEKSNFDLRKGNSYLKKDKDFDGMVIYHDLEGKFVNGWKFLKGKVTHTVKFPENQKVELNLKNAQSNCFTEYVTEWWYVKQYDSYAGVGDDMVYKGTDYDWITVTYATTVCYWDGDGGGSSGDGGGSGGGYNPTPEPVPCNCIYSCPLCGGCLETTNNNCPQCTCPEIIEDPSFENTEADCIKAKLEQGSILNNLLCGFELSTSSINVTYKVGATPGANGKCNFDPNTYRMVITINTDRLNSPSIELARTILHESFHAYLYGKVYEEELHNGLAPEPNFSQDYQKYKEKFGEPDWQHPYIADKYLSYMKQGLLELFNSESYKDNFLSYVKDNNNWFGLDFMLECLAWGGLQGTDAWTTFYSDATNKTNYDNTMGNIVNLIPKENCEE